MAELSLQTVLRKTEAGAQAFNARDRAISQQARALMILLDGVKPVQEVLKFSTDPENGIRMLGELLAAGFVGAVSWHSAAAVQQASAPPSAALLKASIQRATHLLSHSLGPNAESICMQIERCKSMPELSAKIADGARIVGALRSEKAAQEFYRAATAPI